MEYGQLIRDAWQITWRHRFLWILGLFAGGTAGASFGGGGGGDGSGPSAADGAPFPGVDVAAAEVARWAAENVGLIVGVVALLLLLGLAMLVVSFIAQGGLAAATADFASGRSSSLGRAWRTGLHLFWRYVGLWLLLIAVTAGVGALAAAFVALIVSLVAVVQDATWVVAPAALVGLVLAVAGVVAGVVASIVVPYAQRAIAVRDVGPLAALRDGWRVLRAHPGASLLVWLLNLALAIGAGLAIFTAMAATVVMLGIPAVALWATFALAAPTIAYLVIAAVVALGVLLTLISIANTFFWSYWTLAYLRLTPDE